MTDAEKLVLLKTMFGGKKSDDALLAYLSLAGQKVIRRAYPFDPTITSVPAIYAMNQVEIACYLLNKIGAEGETSHQENGINRSYESASVPESMLKDIVPLVGVM